MAHVNKPIFCKAGKASIVPTDEIAITADRHDGKHLTSSFYSIAEMSLEPSCPRRPNPQSQMITQLACRAQLPGYPADVCLNRP